MGLPESVLLDFLDAEPLYVRLTPAKELDEVGAIHVARHTFATTVTLENGVPIRSISKMLGHTNVKTTQLYARITDTKVSNDMDVLQENLQGVFDKPLTQSVKSRKKVAQAKEIAQLAQQLGVAL